MTKTIQDINNVIKKSVLGKSDVVHIMTLLRVLIEEENRQKEFPYIYFYGTWLVHPEIDRNPVCLKILEDLTSVLTVREPGAQNLSGDAFINYFQSKISNALRIYSFREELIKMFKNLGIHARIRNDRVWIGFLLIFLSCLFERPIKLPPENCGNKNVEETYKRIHALSNGVPNFEVIEFSFIHREAAKAIFLVMRKDLSKIYFPKNIDLFFICKLANGSKLVSPLTKIY